MLQLQPLLDLLLHVLKDHLALKLSLTHLVLVLDRCLLHLQFVAFSNLLAHCRADLFVLAPIVTPHLLEIGSLLLELKGKFIFDLQDFTFLVFLQRPSVVLNVCTQLLVELLEASVHVFVRVSLHFVNVVCQLHASCLSFVQFVILDFSLLLGNMDFLVVGLLDVLQ